MHKFVQVVPSWHQTLPNGCGLACLCNELIEFAKFLIASEAIFVLILSNPIELPALLIGEAWCARSTLWSLPPSANAVYGPTKTPSFTTIQSWMSNGSELWVAYHLERKWEILEFALRSK